MLALDWQTHTGTNHRVPGHRLWGCWERLWALTGLPRSYLLLPKILPGEVSHTNHLDVIFSEPKQGSTVLKWLPPSFNSFSSSLQEEKMWNLWQSNSASDMVRGKCLVAFYRPCCFQGMIWSIFKYQMLSGMSVLIVYAYLYVCAYKQTHTYEFLSDTKDRRKDFKRSRWFGTHSILASWVISAFWIVH